MLRGLALGAGFAGLLGMAAPAQAQSLADIAKKEQERRGTMEAAGKAYTNADLVPDPAGEPEVVDTLRAPVASVEPDATQASAAGLAGGDAASAADQTASEPESTLDEPYWRRQARVFHSRVEGARKALEAVSGPSEGNERQQAKVAELRASAEGVLLRAEGALQAFEREARTAGVPEEWIR